MYCPQCGTRNADNAAFCLHCGSQMPSDQPPATAQPPAVGQPFYPQQPPAGQQGAHGGEPLPPKPPTYLAINIVFAVLGFCFSCIGAVSGIVGIVFSAMVTSKYNIGDYQGAQNASRTAKILFFVSLGLVIVGLILNVILVADLVMNGYDSFIYDLMYY